MVCISKSLDVIFCVHSSSGKFLMATMSLDSFLVIYFIPSDICISLERAEGSFRFGANFSPKNLFRTKLGEERRRKMLNLSGYLEGEKYVPLYTRTNIFWWINHSFGKEKVTHSSISSHFLEENLKVDHMKMVVYNQMCKLRKFFIFVFTHESPSPLFLSPLIPISCMFLYINLT